MLYILGAAAIGGAFTPEILRAMGEFNLRPVIFALSNPTSKAECTAEEAYANTDVSTLFTSSNVFSIGFQVGPSLCISLKK